MHCCPCLWSDIHACGWRLFVPVGAYGEQVDVPYPDLMLRSPLGRQFLAGLLGLDGFSLSAELGLGEASGISTYRPRRDRGHRPRRSRRWQEVAPDEISQ